MKLEASWHEKLKKELSEPYIEELKNFLKKEKGSGCTIYPPEPLVFHAFLHTPYPKVRVVIMGQDPYHGAGQAHGLSFSVPCGIPHPPSLKNIFLELKEDVGVPLPVSGALESWAKQGVLMLNATLTVRASEPKSHHGKGWERFTDAVVAALLEKREPVIFVLWGKSAQEKVEHIAAHQKTGHIILTASHPSPYSVHQSFFGCRHFSKINQHLIRLGQTPINWRLD